MGYLSFQALIMIQPTYEGLALMKRMGGEFCIFIARAYEVANAHDRKKLLKEFGSYFQGFNDNAAFIEKRKHAQ